MCESVGRAHYTRWLRNGGTGGRLSPHEPVNTCPEKGTSSLEMTCLRGLRITRGMYAISISWVVPWVSVYDDAQIESHWSRSARTRAAQNLLLRIRKMLGDAKPPLPGYTDRIRPSAGTSTARTSRSGCAHFLVLTPFYCSSCRSRRRALLARRSREKFADNFCHGGGGAARLGSHVAGRACRIVRRIESGTDMITA